MPDRKKIIEDIVTNIHVMKHTLQPHLFRSVGQTHVTPSQLFALMLIEHEEEIGVKELAQRLAISSSAATQLVDGLVKGGYALRKADPRDGRALHIVLSRKGEKQLSVLWKKRMQLMGALFRALSTRELLAYRSLQKKILSRLTS
ncbi:MarR family transcriptional regulator [Patescibacteria group bacterium]|nr:MarR family transcriptional regulator [Patescibacteria group bacterium]